MVGPESLALSQFRLPSPRIVGSLPASARNDNFLVEDARGERYVLRCYRRNPQPERIEFQLRFQQHLLHCGFPTSRVVEASDGERMLVAGSEFWALFTYIRGAEYNHGCEAQLREAARLLAQFHRSSESFDTHEVSGDTIPDIRRWWIEGDGELQRLGEMFANLGVEAELDFLRAWHSQLVLAWPRATLDALPVAWVHGDYHGRNMVFVADRLAGLFDFDVVHRGFRIEDVALALFTFGRESHNSEHIRPDAARLLVGQYDRELPLSELERRALPMMASVVQARTAARYALRQRSGEDPRRALRTHVSRMRTIHSQMASLGPALVDP